MAYNGIEPLAELTVEQRQRVEEWLDEKRPHRQIAADLALPEPEGCGVVVSPAAVSRFAKRWKALRLAEALDEKKEMAARIMESELHNGADLAKASMSVLMGRIFDEALETTDPKAHREILKLLVDNQAKQERVEIAKANHALARDRFRFNAGREVMKHWHALKNIHETRGVDDQAKIEKARDIAFGLLPNAKDEGRGLKVEIIPQEQTGVEKVEGGITAGHADGADGIDEQKVAKENELVREAEIPDGGGI